MIEKIIEIKNRLGLHARPAAMLIKEASKYVSEIKVIKEGKEYNAKSIMDILNMGVAKEDKILIRAQGNDEKEAVEALIKLADANFGE